MHRARTIVLVAALLCGVVAAAAHAERKASTALRDEWTDRMTEAIGAEDDPLVYECVRGKVSTVNAQ